MADVVARRITQIQIPDEAVENGMALIRNFIRFGFLSVNISVDTVNYVVNIGNNYR